MIGVLAKEHDKEIAREFFELFKTPWEFYRANKSYNVVLCNNVVMPTTNANTKYIIAFGARDGFGESGKIGKALLHKENINLRCGGKQFPIYNEVMTFPSNPDCYVTIPETGAAVTQLLSQGSRKILRVGYNLFDQIRLLITRGQPASLAHVPTLDIHISNLREWILDAGIPIVEIPPLPLKHRFFACLTHDVDFVGIRNHKMDRTLLGFIYRASIGSFLKLLRGRLSLRKLWHNLKALLLLLPLIHFGLYEDIWVCFRKYAAIEEGLSSTFFFVPFQNQCGLLTKGKAPENRKIKYDVEQIGEEIGYLVSKGFEIGVHGIDSWIDDESGKKEYHKISELSNARKIGARMHWLYFNHHTPENLEKAGYFYDTSFGYNDAIGYRAGTHQAFRFPGTKDLMELPLHIQDTALFYPGRMNLSEKIAFEQVERLIENAASFGGVMTINWHHRSIAPERQWGEFYEKLLECLKHKNAKFLTAAETVEWYKGRRSVVFESSRRSDSTEKIKIKGITETIPSDLFVRMYRPTKAGQKNKANHQNQVEIFDYPLKDQSEFALPLTSK